MMPNPENRCELIINANRAILGEIRPNIRKISIEYDKEIKTITLYFYFDAELTQKELDYDIPNTIISKLSKNFSRFTGLILKSKVFIIPYPTRIESKGISIYSRYEVIPECYLNSSF